MIGKDGIEAEIKKIRQQKLADGMDIDDMAAEDELCARMLPQILLHGAAVERLAQSAVDAVNTLRKTLRAIQEHLDGIIVPSAIRQDMPENYRYQYLKDKMITVEKGRNLSEYQGVFDKLSSLKPTAKGDAEKVLKPFIRGEDVLNKPLLTPALDFEFSFSGKSLDESLHKQLSYGGSYIEFAKAIANMDVLLKNAVLIERHGDKYKGTNHENEYLENTSVLISAFEDGSSIIPVQMEIKSFPGRKSVLYMTVALKK